MPRRPKYWHMIQASKREMLLAVDLWNQRGSEVNTTAFVVHAQIAWLYLCHARFERDQIDYWHRNEKGKRIRDPQDNAFRAWALRRCLEEIFPNKADPVRQNIEFFIGIRNKIEHRWERGLSLILTGRIQALVLNYEAALSNWFKEYSESLADELRFPIFLSSLTPEAVDSAQQVWERLPNGLRTFIRQFDESLPETVADDQRYEFRVALIPHSGSSASSPVSMTFVHEDQLTIEQRRALGEAITIIREKHVPVANLGELKPTDVAGQVEAALGVKFRPTPHHSTAWRYFGVRPPSDSDKPHITVARYCTYSQPYNSYTYTDAWVRKLIRELDTPERFEEVTGQKPVPLDPVDG